MTIITARWKQTKAEKAKMVHQANIEAVRIYKRMKAREELANALR